LRLRRITTKHGKKYREGGTKNPSEKKVKNKDTKNRQEEKKKYESGVERIEVGVVCREVS